MVRAIPDVAGTLSKMGKYLIRPAAIADPRKTLPRNNQLSFTINPRLTKVEINKKSSPQKGGKIL